MSAIIREITQADFASFWPTFSAVIKAQQSYAFDPDMTQEQAFALWCEMPIKTFVYVHNNAVLGSYYLKANALGPSNHICNCGYMLASAARGQGIAQTLCEHSQLIAQQLGFQAMQFNNVVSTNEGAIRLWHKLGFETIGRIPNAYRHGDLGYVDSLIMYKWLAP